MKLTPEVRQVDINLRNQLVKSGAWATCTNCTHWLPGNGQAQDKCELYNVTPPANVIITGCVNHQDEIPF